MLEFSLFRRFRTNIAELISAYYLNCFFILKPLLNEFNHISSILLFGNLFFLVILFVFFSESAYDKRKVKIYVLLSISVLLALILNFFLRSTEGMFEYLRFLIIYGIVPAFFFLKVSNWSFFFKSWTFFAVVAGVILIDDPFNAYAICGDYMVFGLGVLPAFAVSVIQLFLFKIKWFIIPLLVFAFEIVFFAHKGATFTSLFLLIFIFFYSKQSALKNIFFGIGISCFFVFYKPVIEFLIKIANELGVNSYSLTGFERMFLLSASDEVAKARVKIWENVFFELEDNFALGMGIGNFEFKYGSYPHNFFLEILITYGIPLGVIIFTLLFCSIMNVIHNCKNRDAFVFLMTMFFLWFIPMMSSFTYWAVMPFWVFIFVSFYFGGEKNVCSV